MGQYLSIGIAKTIYIRKNYKDEDESILKDLFPKNFRLDFYDVVHEKDYIGLVLKDEILEKNVVKLLEEVKHLASKDQEEDFDKAIKTLQGKTAKEMVKIAEDHELYAFHYLPITYGNSYIKYMTNYNYHITCSQFSMVLDGKIIIECYSDVFSVLRNALVESLDNELKYTLIINITG